MDRILEMIIPLCEHNCIDKAILFGSRARGDFKSNSDYDIAIIADKSDYKRFIADIEDLHTLYKIDVVLLSTKLSQKFLENVKNEGVIFYEKQ